MARQEITLPELGEPLSHYAHAVRFGNLLFVSGCAPIDARGQLVGGDDVLAQTRQVLHQLRTALQAVGLGPADVLKVTVYLTDIQDRARINPLRQEFFGSSRPASTLVEVSRLAVPGMLVEIEAIAGFPEDRGAFAEAREAFPEAREAFPDALGTFAEARGPFRKTAGRRPVQRHAPRPARDPPRPARHRRAG